MPYNLTNTACNQMITILSSNRTIFSLTNFFSKNSYYSSMTVHSKYIARKHSTKSGSNKYYRILTTVLTNQIQSTKQMSTELTVSWSLTSLFSTNMAISEIKGQGWKVVHTQWRKTSDILTSTLAAFLFSSHPKKGKGSRGSFKLLL